MPKLVDGQYITVRLRLEPTEEQLVLLEERTALYTSLLNSCMEMAIKQPRAVYINGTKLHHVSYRKLRELYPQLPSADIITARNKVVEMLKARDANIYELEKHIQWRKEHKRKARPKLKKQLEKLRAVVPHFKSTTVPLPYSVGYRLWREKREISLTTTRMRARMQYTASEYARAQLDSSLAFKEAKLYHDPKKHRWYLYVATFQECPQKRIGVPLGVDQGVVNLITTDDGYKVLGDAVWKRVERYQNLYSRLRSAADNGSRSAKRHLKQSSGRLRRYTNDMCHCIAKDVVRYTCAMGRGAIALENLKGLEFTSMSKYMRKIIRRWPHAQFTEYITYKARLTGLDVIFISPAHTSTTCSICGYQNPLARISRDIFRCPQCGDLDADVNAAKNIALRAMQRAL